MAAKNSLDSFDRQILDCLQTDADMPLAEVARKVGLSTTPCWRRINRLQEQGIIRARVALLDRRAVNAGVTVFVAVRTAQHSARPDRRRDFAGGGGRRFSQHRRPAGWRAPRAR